MEPLWYQCWETLEPEQEISRKNSILIHFISLLEWPKVWHLYMYFFFLITVITQQKDRPILCWINLILAVGNSLKLLIFEFSQFRPDLIAPINFGSRRSSPPSPQVSAALPRTFACISAGALRLWRSVMQIDQVSQEPARLRMLTAPFHGTFFSTGSS